MICKCSMDAPLISEGVVHVFKFKKTNISSAYLCGGVKIFRSFDRDGIYVKMSNFLKSFGFFWGQSSTVQQMENLVAMVFP